MKLVKLSISGPNKVELEYKTSTEMQKSVFVAPLLLPGQNMI